MSNVQKSESPGGAGLNANNQYENASADCGVDERQGKHLATLQAQFALIGYGLVELADGNFLLTRWAYSRSLPSLYAASALLRQLGGQS